MLYREREGGKPSNFRSEKTEFFCLLAAPQTAMAMSIAQSRRCNNGELERNGYMGALFREVTRVKEKGRHRAQDYAEKVQKSRRQQTGKNVLQCRLPMRFVGTALRNRRAKTQSLDAGEKKEREKSVDSKIRSTL